MGRASVTRKDKAYKLFSEDHVPSSPEVKALGLSKGSRDSYYSEWKAEGQPAPSVERKAKAKAPAPPLGRETIAAISEVPVEESKGKEEELKGES